MLMTLSPVFQVLCDRIFGLTDFSLRLDWYWISTLLLFVVIVAVVIFFELPRQSLTFPLSMLALYSLVVTAYWLSVNPNLRKLQTLVGQHKVAISVHAIAPPKQRQALFAAFKDTAFNMVRLTKSPEELGPGGTLWTCT